MGLSDAELEQKTKERMEKIGMLEDEGTEDATIEDEQLQEPESEVVEPEPEPEPESEVVESETGEVPHNLKRAAVHQGWSDEQIQKFYKADPELAKQTFEKIYESTNNLSSRWAALGQQVLQQQQEQARNPQPTPQQPTDVVDLAALKEEYPDNPLIDGIIKPLNETLKKLTAGSQQQQPQPQQQYNPAAQIPDQLREIRAQKIDLFFKDKSLVPDPGYYGTGLGWQELSPGQRANRMAVLETADLIQAGAALHGTRISDEDAMSYAHMQTAAPYLKQMVRQEIQGEMKKRNRGITLAPKGRKLPEPEIKTEDDLLKVTKQRLKNVFGS